MTARCLACIDNKVYHGAFFCDRCWALVPDRLRERVQNIFPASTEDEKVAVNEAIKIVRTTVGRWKKKPGDPQ